MCLGGEIKVSVSIYDGKKLVTTEELVISEKNDLVNKEWFMKYLPLSQHNIKVLMLCLTQNRALQLTRQRTTLS
jgi:hypothetical protein